jgi:coenzyme F420-0:L-glutamate ligase/coenzyme F420-1:gamma-L-glutamate ligase
MEEDLHAFLRSRRSVRHFRPEAVSGNVIQRILETAICAPSAHNLQPWRFIVLINADGKLRLAEAFAGKFRQDMIGDNVPEEDIQRRVGQTICRCKEAPVIIVLCRDRTKVKPQPDPTREGAEALMGIQSTALAGLQLLLAAHAEGLGGTWICWPLFAPAETLHALELDPAWEPQGMIFLGYPAEKPDMAVRIPFQEVARFL